MVSLLPGGQLGRYQIIETIGRGGMATVFEAHDPDLDRTVAIKVLPSFHTEDPAFVERFRREAQAVARLNHPNIIRVHDFGEDKGFSYIVMEHVTGGTLLDRLKGPLPFPEALDLVAPLAGALESAHRQGVVHRDIKPANVLMDEEGAPILSDFGLARMLEGSAGLTKADSLLGTPEYMAPEQALGRPADQRSDLYALGVVIYQMLLGRTPFRGETPTETLMAHIHQPVPNPREVDPNIAPRLELVLLRALAKSPDDRYQSPKQLLEALRLASPEPGAQIDADATVKTPAFAPAGDAPRAKDGKDGPREDTKEAVQPHISRDQSRVLAMRTARETPGAYGRSLGGVPMAFEVTAEEETEDYYVVTLSYRPQGSFTGTPGQEQFFIDKEGTVAHRQVLSLSRAEGGRRIQTVPIILGLAAAVIVVGTVVGVLVMSGGTGQEGGDTAPPAGPVGATTPPSGPEMAALSATLPTPASGSPSAPRAIPSAGLAVRVGAAVQGEGVAVVWDDQALGDAITYTMSGVTPLPEGRVYMGWLVSDDGSLKLGTGAMAGEPDGSIDHNFDHNSRGYTGANLVNTYSKVVITTEETGARFDAPIGPPVFSHEVPLGAMEHIRHLLTNWPEGADKGILTNLREQLQVALFHATLAKGSNTLKETRQHTEHVVNIIEGPRGPNYGDLDGNGVAEDPGDGVGVLTHAVDRKHGTFASAQAEDDPVIIAHAELVVSHGKRAEDLALLARDQALQVLATEDMTAAKNLLGPGDDTVITLLDAALNGTGIEGEGSAVRAYLEAQLMAAYFLTPISGAAVISPPGGHITYGLPSQRVFRIEATEGAVPEDISQVLDALSEPTQDAGLNTSPDGQWLALHTLRFDPDCAGWLCLAILSSDLSTQEVIRTTPPGPGLVHPGQGLSAVASGGNLLVYQQEWTVSSHITDLFAITRADGGWSDPMVFTADSPYIWHENPAISGDGSRVIFQCGNDSREGHAICEVGTDGTGFRVVLTPADSPPGARTTGTLHNPDYAPDGSIVFAADWDGKGVWRLPVGAAEPVLLRSQAWWPCVLPDGRVVTASGMGTLEGPEAQLHIGVMDPDGGGYTVLTTVEQANSLTGGLGCGG